MKMPIIATFVAAVLSCASLANAEMGFAGAGTSSCSFINTNAVPGTDSNQNMATILVFTWVQGFLSGMNATAYNLPDERALFDLGKITTRMQWDYLVAYCQANPTAMIATAAINLGTKRLKP
jgi:hypothetical protein